MTGINDGAADRGIVDDGDAGPGRPVASGRGQRAGGGIGDIAGDGDAVDVDAIDGGGIADRALIGDGTDGACRERRRRAAADQQRRDRARCQKTTELAAGLAPPRPRPFHAPLHHTPKCAAPISRKSRAEFRRPPAPSITRHAADHNGTFANDRMELTTIKRSTSSRDAQRQLVAEIEPAHGVGDQTVEGLQDPAAAVRRIGRLLWSSAQDPSFPPPPEACGHGCASTPKRPPRSE